MNFYGITQINGANLAFYQPGVMCGGATDPTDENVFSNESWMKATAAASIMNLQLGTNEISADTAGENAVTNALMTDVVNAGLFNGTIRKGKPLTSQAQAYITSLTGNSNAWIQVQNSGYWLQVVIVPWTDPITQLPGYQIQYTLIYSKNDVVRFVSGTHSLI